MILKALTCGGGRRSSPVVFMAPDPAFRYENLTSNPIKYRPAVNQVELSFGNPQPELLAVRISTDCLPF